MAAAGVGVEAHLWTVAAIGAVVGVVLTRFLLPRGVDAAPEGPSFARPTRALALAGLFAFCVLLSEGAVNDWAAVYLHGELGAGQGAAAAGLAAFSLTMGIGRLAGDGLSERLGPTRLARGGALVATTGMALALSVGTPAVAVAGFAVMGIGLAALFPLALRAAATSGQVPGPAVAAVSAMGYMGLLTGPPVVGLLSEARGPAGGAGAGGGAVRHGGRAGRRGARSGQSWLKKLIPRSSIRDSASEFSRVSSLV